MSEVGTCKACGREHVAMGYFEGSWYCMKCFDKRYYKKKVEEEAELQENWSKKS